MNGQGATSFGFRGRAWTSTRVGPVSRKGSGVGVAPSAMFSGLVPEALSSYCFLLDRYAHPTDTPYMACFSGVFVSFSAGFHVYVWIAVWDYLVSLSLSAS